MLTASFAFATIGSAQTVDGRSRSYLQWRESPGGSDLLPGYEYLDLSARDIGSEAFSVHFGGWGRYDFEQENGDTDIQYAYVSYRGRYDNSVVNLGRVMVFEGVAAERVDGAYARTDLAGNFGLSAFGGVPVETGIDTPGNDIIFGARLSQEKAGLYRIGVSALREEKNSDDFREEEGLDLWYRPLDYLELLGKSSYDSVDTEWMEHAYSLILGPFNKLRFNTEASRYDYSAYLRTATTSALNFSAGLHDPNETASFLGEEVSYAATDTVTVFANYRYYSYNKAGNASSYGARVNYARAQQGSAGLSVHRMDGDEERLRYTQYRLYGARMIGKIDVAVDLINVAFDEDIGGEDNAYSAALIAVYNLTPSLRVGADVEYLSRPTFDDDVRVFAKIIYRFGFRTGGGAS
jgi:hypothetical protein